MSEIKPALTAEEWARGGRANAPRPGDWAFINGAGSVTIQTAEGGPVFVDGERHALAALCLHGQPFGFTWEMWRAVLSSLYYGAGAKTCPSCGGGGWKMVEPPICADCGFQPLPRGEYRALTKAAADRIAALLPPREP